MDGMGKKGMLVAAMLGICEIAALKAAYAQPPLQKVTAALGRGAAKGQERTSPRLDLPRLDLRLPSQTPASDPGHAAPAGTHRLFAGESPFRSDGHTASQAPSGHIMSPMESVVHNFHQEGLPLARLFQNSNSLVQVGLNPKGKPGLWVVHKLH
jgi:hypothetical protein